MLQESCEMLLIQHALTQWNIDRRTQGHTDTPLSDIGRAMAESLAERLKDECIDLIYSSDLRRAIETAEPLSRLINKPIIKIQQLREGRWASQEKNSEYPVLDFYVESENKEDVRKRVINTFTEICDANIGKRIAVVTHGGVIKAFLKHLKENGQSGIPEYKGIRTSINIFRYQNSKWECIEMNDTKHLNPAEYGLNSADMG
jgi:broad specificity phosphatase PhoE